MAEKTVKIPKPTGEQILALQRMGISNHRLVWDRNNRTWSVKKLDDVFAADITYQDWQGGQKSYEGVTQTSAAMPSDVEKRVRDTTDPLIGVIEQYGLAVTTDPERGITQLKGFIIDPATGKRATTAVEHFIYLDSKNQLQVSSDYDAIKNKALKDLKESGQLDALFQDLYNKKKISKDTYNSRNTADSAFNAAFLGAIRNYSTTVINNRELGLSTEAPNFLNVLKGLETGGDEQPLGRRTFQDISKVELNAFIDSIYLETIGRKPTEEQRSAKLKELNKIVKQGVLTTERKVGGEIQSRTTGGFDQQEQQLKLQEQLKTENPLEYERRQAFGFMDELQKIMSGGM